MTQTITEGVSNYRDDNHMDIMDSEEIADICYTMMNRCGYEGGFDELYDLVSNFMDELARQLCAPPEYQKPLYTITSNHPV